MSERKRPDLLKQVKDDADALSIPTGKAAVDRAAQKSIKVWPEVYEAVECLRERHESRGSVLARAMKLLIEKNPRKVPNTVRRDFGCK